MIASQERVEMVMSQRMLKMLVLQRRVQIIDLIKEINLLKYFHLTYSVSHLKIVSSFTILSLKFLSLILMKV